MTLDRSMQRLVIGGTAIAVLWSLVNACAIAGVNETQHYLVVSTPTDNFSSFASPSVNGQGDLVFRGILSDNSRKIMAYLWDANTASYYSRLIQTGTGTLTIATPYPEINTDRTVAFSRTETGEFGSVRQRVFNPTANDYLSSESIAEWDLVSPYSRPFRDSSVYVSIANNGSVAFWNRAQGVLGEYKAVFAGSTKITNPASAIVAEESIFAINALDRFVDASNAGWVVRGYNIAGDVGIYRVSTPGSPQRITPASDFIQLGARPSINDSGTIAFYGERTDGTKAVFLNFSGNSDFVNTNKIGVQPAGVSNTVDKIAINKYNQVAYLGTNAAGNAAVFSTNLGATREIIAVGDSLAGSTVTALRIHDGLMDSGQLAYLAITSDGNQHIVRTNRAYSQAKLNDTPAPVPWATRGYLLKDIGMFGGAAAGTIRKYGCNLSSTANALSYYANDITPGALQDWLIDNWQNASTAAARARYIVTPSNDFQENFVEEFTREQFNAGRTDTIVTMRPYTSNGTTGDNRRQLLEELQQGHAVKLRVPSRTGANYRAFGHYILAYGLSDPTKPLANMTNENVLIHDPGNGGVYTLAQYEQKYNYQTTHPGWLDDTQSNRLSVYEGYRGVGPLPASLNVSVFSPIEVVLTDPTGKRLGFDLQQGLLSEIVGGQYWHEEPYYSLDEGSDPEPVWPETIKHIYIADPMPGNYSLDIVGTATGDFQIVMTGGGPFQIDQGYLSGTITVGQRMRYDLTAVPEPSSLVALLGIATTMAMFLLRRRATGSNRR